MATARPLPNPGRSSGVKLENLVDFNGGLNTTANRFDLKANESPDCQNVDVDRRGGIIRRSAATVLHSTGVALTVNVPFLYNVGSSSETFVLGNRVFSSLSGTGTATTYAYGGCGAAFGSSVWVFNVDLTPTVFNAGATNYKSGVAMTTSGIGRWQDSYAAPSTTHAPNAKVCAVHLGSYMFLGCLDEYIGGGFGQHQLFGNRIRWSHPGDPGSWRTNDYIDIGQTTDPIMALVSMTDHLVILKRNSVWALHGYDPDTFNLVQITDDLGLCGERAWTLAPEGLYFWDARKFLHLYSSGTIRWMAEKIASTTFPTYDPPTFGGSFEQTAISYGEYGTVALGYSTQSGRIWCSVPDATSRATPENAYSLVFDPVVNAWTKATVKTNAFVSFRGKLIGHWGTRTFWAEDTTATRDTYLGTTDHIDGYWVSAWHDAGQPVVGKRWTKPEFILTGNQAGSFVVTVYKDYDPITVEKTITVTSTNPLATSSDYDQVFRTQVIGSAKAVALKFAGPTAEHVLWRLDGYTLKYKMKTVRS